MLRAAVKAGTELGKKAQGIMKVKKKKFTQKKKKKPKKKLKKKKKKKRKENLFQMNSWLDLSEKQLKRLNVKMDSSLMDIQDPLNKQKL